MSVKRASSYAQVSASVRAMKSAMLGTPGYDRLLRCSTTSECMSVLTERDYFDTAAGTSVRLDPSMWQSLFDAKMTALIRKLAQLSPDDCARLLRKFENMYHLESLKLGLRLMVAHGKEDTASDSVWSYLSADMLRSIVETRDLERLVQATGAAGLYSEISSAMAENKPLPLVEGIVDKYALTQIWEAADMSDWIDKQSVQSLVGEQIDAVNLLLVARSKALGIADDELQGILVPVNYHLREALHEAVGAAPTTNALRPFLKTVYGGLVGEFLETFREGYSLHPLDVSLRRRHAAKCSAVFLGFPFCAGLPLAFTYLMGYEISDVRSIIFGKDDGLAPETIEQSLILWKTL